MDNGESSYRRFLDGDDSGIVEIIKDYKDGLTLYLNGYVRDIFVAEELMEETFFKIITKKPKFKGKSTFKTWLYAVGRNTALDYIRKNGRLELHGDMPTDNVIECRSVENQFFRDENKIKLYEAMNRINPEYCQVLYLIYFEDCTNEQAAFIMKKKKRQIENLIYRAKKALKTELEKEDITYEES